MGTGVIALLTGAVAAAGVAVAIVAAVLWLRERARAERLEDELEAARGRAAAADEARETFFDLATHELRSPLSAILGYQELLRDGAYGSFEPGAEEPVDRIGRSARHLLHLIDGVVELSRLRTGTVRPDLEPVNLALLMKTVAEGFRTHARERGLDAEVRIDDDLPTIHSDQDRLVRALDLLITSAIKHPAGSGMSLRIDPLDDGASLAIGGAEITLRDDAEDPALRLGIRLAVASRIAELLGGELRLEPSDAGPIERLVFTIHDAQPTAARGL